MSPTMTTKKRKLEDFVRLKLLGKGAYGSCYLIEDSFNKDKYAMKVIQKGRLKGSTV